VLLVVMVHQELLEQVVLMVHLVHQDLKEHQEHLV
jgi:hypothetical protein